MASSDQMEELNLEKNKNSSSAVTRKKDRDVSWLGRWDCERLWNEMPH